MKNILKNAENAEKLLELTSDTMILLDRNGICVDIAVHNADLWFLKENQLLDRNILQLLPSVTYRQVYPEFKKVLAYKEVSARNYELTIGSETYFFKCIMRPYEDMVLCQYRDITERSQRKRELEKRNHELNEIQKAALIGRWKYNSGRQCFYYTGHSRVMCTEEEQEIPLQDYIMYILPEDREIFGKWLAQNLQGNTENSIDYRIRFKKRIFYIRLKTFSHEILPDGTGILEGYIQNITDIQQRRNDITLLTHAINNSTEDIFAAREDGTLVFANRRFREHHNISMTDDVSTLNIYRINTNAQDENSWQRLIKSLRKGDKRNGFILYHPLPEHPEVLAMEGSAYWVTSDKGEAILWGFSRDITQRIRNEQQIKRFSQILDKRKMRIESSDFPPILLSIEWDITEMERMKRELLVAKEKAETSDQLKSAFLANMSHEIRTPLNAIVGFSRIIAESTDAEERQDYYDIVEANNERLLQLINEILDLSKIEAGMVEFTITPVRLHPLCKEIHDALKFRCPEGVELVYEASDEEIVVEGDKNRIFQVISNLIGNAFKFTTSGSVGYGYRRKGNGIEFHVSDTGIGIETDKLARVFERFVKVNNFAQGTGLGLSICKTIIERLGGTISVSSEVGKGTTFTFTLPLTEGKRETAEEQNPLSEAGFNTPGNAETRNNTCGPDEETHEHQATQTSGASRDTRKPTILIAEDTDSNYVLVKAILGKSYHLERAKDGMEAVTMFEELHPDLILMDMKMPNLSGLDATKIIRELSPGIPVIALTAYAYEHDRQAALDAGCNDFLTKPYTQEILKELINKYLKQTGVSSPG